MTVKIEDRERIASSVADAAEISGLGKGSLYVLINQGKLRTGKFGKRRLIYMDSLRELIESLEVKP